MKLTPKWLRPHKKYAIRHSILLYLYRKAKYNENHVIKLDTTITPLTEISSSLGVPIEDIVLYHHAFHEEATCLHDNEKRHCMILLEKGIDAVVDEKWVREGEKELNDRIYDKLKWITPLIAVILAALSFAYTIVTVQRIKEKVSVLESKVSLIEHNK